MKLALIGARKERPGLGAALLSEFSSHGYEVTAFSKADCNIVEQDWLKVLKSPFDIIILNAFDHQHPEAQLKAFQALFEKFKSDSKVQLVVIGSMAHYFKKETPYEKAKFYLYDFVMSHGKYSLAYACKLLLFEPGTLDNLLRHNKHAFTYSTVEETAQMLRTAVEMNQKFIHLAMRGNRKANAVVDNSNF